MKWIPGAAPEPATVLSFPGGMDTGQKELER